MPRIFVAEDSPLQIEMIKTVLSRHLEFDLRFFSDGLQLYRVMQKEPPDLALLDIIMPSLSGLAVTRLIKFHRDTRHVKIIVVSSITEEDLPQVAKQCGADAFLPKPLDFEELEQVVVTLLS